MAAATSQSGVALVITLIMLSVITFLTIAFLAISRRDRASVTTSINQTDARLMADAALARFQTELVSGMIARNDLKSYDLMLTRNYINPLGFNPLITTNDTNNVNYDFRSTDGNPLNPNNDRIFNIANLFFDPRPPVYIRTNINPLLPADFRFYLDYNRNGRFETNGLQPIFINETGGTNGTANFIGEPEWIGVLQHPELPHGPDNKFIGRYLYLALPIGKTLDLNYIHNYAKGVIQNVPQMPGNGDRFIRNQGFGSWELNLAGFLNDLNTNMYSAAPFYTYVPSDSSVRNDGYPFEDAVSFLGYRYGRNFNNLSSVMNLFGFTGQTNFQTDLIDGYSTRPVLTAPFINEIDPDFKPTDLTTQPWSGSNNTNLFTNPQELFDNTRSPANFVSKLQLASTKNNSYDRYTFSRLLEQLGMSSTPEVKGKININYSNDVSLNLVTTNFVPWTPIQFFTNVADRLFKDNLTYQLVSPGVTNWYMFNTNNQANLVRAGFTYTNIQIYPTNEYTAPVHRLLQLAANIYDATTTNKFPSVFRPQFRTSNNVNFVGGYTNDNTTNFLSNLWITRNLPLITDNNVFGIPVVIGAKKGFPNFNKFVMQNAVQISRNLQLRRATTNSPPNETNQMYNLGVSNLFGIQGWNSYAADYTNRLEIRITNFFTAVLTNETGAVVWPNTGTYLRTNLFSTVPLFSAKWPGAKLKPYLSNSFVVPLGTIPLIFLTNSQYRAPTFIPHTTNYDRGLGFPTPIWVLNMTNRLTYILIDTDQQRVIDFVSLDSLSSRFDISGHIIGNELTAIVPGGNGGGIAQEMNLLWNTNRVGGTTKDFPTRGIIEQILVSRGERPPANVSDDIWKSFNAPTYAGTTKDNAILNFKKFTDGNSTPDTVVQTPYNPTRKMAQTLTWEANDPLVHYMKEDLLGTTNAVVIEDVLPSDRALPGMRLKEISTRYKPWGGNHEPGTAGVPQESDEHRYDLKTKDPLVRWSDDWDFPTNKFPSIGWLGRVHRGTPWQTIYLKAAVADSTNWFQWAGHNESHPTNDWRLMDVFTASANDNAARGLLSVNQTNQAAWSAALSGVIVLSNSGPNPLNQGAQFTNFVIQPNSPQLLEIVTNLNAWRDTQPNRVFHSIGEILGAPNLSVTVDTNNNTFGSRYLNFSSDQISYGLTDEAVERIPRQIMSLLKLGDPRFVVYCYGQSLKPANDSLVLRAPSGSGLFNLCTNYQITGEVLTRTLLHVEGTTDNPKVVIEGYNVLPSD